MQAIQPGWWNELWNQVYGWLFNTRPGYKPYDLYYPDSPVTMPSY
jgi:hypothetical protein